ncbi:His Kinase A (phospho-acceptor) domain-containing protein [Shimia marina]|uniref:histidine kinase n=2 Tax=Shimia marina TaxID=321267 RepID=A0A0P1FDT5_9RHOB|nr:Autoinducer 2 sensor kinase/phosphatase LuxQ [Shimia marina]SFE83120.1 His Kinase A (phospho-acceptor) domain-containing protein [Shimia marina]
MPSLPSKRALSITAISQRHLRKRLGVAIAVLVIPLLIVSATSIAYQKKASLHARYVIAVGQLLEGMAKLKGDVALLETGRESDLGEFQKTYGDALKLFTALRAADPDGEETLEVSNAENRELLTARIREAAINPEQVSRELGLFEHEMPSSLVEVWEEENEWEVSSFEQVSIEKAVGMSLLAAADLIEAPAPLTFDQFWSAYEMLPDNKINQVTTLLNATARGAYQAPIFLTFLMVAAACLAAIFAWVSIVRPLINQILEMQLQLREEAMAAQASDMAKTQFLATISHELRTPMNGIIGAAQLLEVADLSEEDKDLIDILNSCAANQMDLIEEILTFGEIEAGALEMREDPLDVSDLIKSATNFANVLTQKKGLSLEVRVSRHMPPILGDVKRLRQIVVNLVGNAIKFTEAGTITVEAVVEQSEDEQHGVLRISVKDTGVGIAIEDQEKIFDRFTQVDSSSTRKAGGTGLGLSIAQGIAQKANGKITLESQLGSGSTFTLEIPTEIISSAEVKVHELRRAV